MDQNDKLTEIVVVAGMYEECIPPSPPPNSWAARTEADVAVWTIMMEENAIFTLPSAHSETNRVLYFFSGTTIEVDGQSIKSGHGVQLEGGAEVEIKNGNSKTEILLFARSTHRRTRCSTRPFCDEYNWRDSTGDDRLSKYTIWWLALEKKRSNDGHEA